VSLDVAAHSDAPPERVWALYAQPDRWREWAPHIRSPRGLGSPEVEAGARGSIRLAGVAPIPARITAVDPGKAWTWRVGPLSLRHTVSREAGGGTAIGLDIEAPRPLELAMRFTYAPLTRVLLANLGRVAERG
jgi:uncharacterized protein YndB with AHSA1/START domain